MLNKRCSVLPDIRSQHANEVYNEGWQTNTPHAKEDGGGGVDGHHYVLNRFSQGELAAGTSCTPSLRLGYVSRFCFSFHIAQTELTFGWSPVAIVTWGLVYMNLTITSVSPNPEQYQADCKSMPGLNSSCSCLPVWTDQLSINPVLNNRDKTFVLTLSRSRQWWNTPEAEKEAKTAATKESSKYSDFQSWV